MFKRSKRFHKFLYSYIALIIIVLFFVGGIVHKSVIGKLRYKVEQLNMSALNQAADIIDIRFRELDSIALRISLNPNLTPFMLKNYGYNYYLAARELNNYRFSNLFIYDIALYYNNLDNNTIYAASGTYRSEIFFKRAYGYVGFGEKELQGLFPNMSSPIIRSMEEVKINGLNTGNFATYIYPLPSTLGRPYGAVIFLIEYNSILKVVNSVLHGYSGHFFIIDKNHCNIFATPVENSEKILDAVLYSLNTKPLTNNVNTLMVDKEKYSVLISNSTYKDFIYIMAMPINQFFHEVYTTEKFLYYSVVLITIIGILLSILFSKRNYMPLRKLISILHGSDAAFESIGRQDEFDYIYTSVNEIIKSNQVLSSQLKSKTNIVKKFLLLDLLTNKKSEREEKNNLLEAFNIKLNGSSFVVMLFCIDNYNDFKRKYPPAMQELIKISMTTLLEDFLNEFCTSYSVELTDGKAIAFILSFYNNNHNIPALAFKAKNKLKQYFDFTCTIGIGNIYDDIWAIHTSYMEASRAAFHRILKGGDQVIFYNDIILEQKNLYEYPTDLEEQLIMIIRQGKVIDIQDIFEDIFTRIQSQSLIPEAVQCICFGILNSIIKTLNDIGTDLSHALKNDIEHLIITEYDSIDAIKNMMINLGKKVCQHVSSVKKSNNIDKLEQIMSYIHDNYSRSSLSLKEIAMQFNMSPPYITTIFKDYTGYTLMHYVDMLRMKKAKELLKISNLPQYEIISQVGYTDQTNFIRKFKSIEGITPSIYRKLARRDISLS